MGGLLTSQLATAQIVHEKPGKIKAANRRALREAKSTESPYKDSHLSVTPARLKRGGSAQVAPEGSKRLQYRDGNVPNVKKPGLLGIGRKKKQ